MRDDRDLLFVTVAERMHARVDELVQRQLIALRRLRSYDRVPDDDLVRSCRRNVARVVATRSAAVYWAKRHGGVLPDALRDES